MMTLRDRVWGGDYIMRLHLLITEAPERSLALQPCEEDTARRPHSEPGRGLSPAPESAGALILDLPATRAVSNTFFCCL